MQNYQKFDDYYGTWEVEPEIRVAFFEELRRSLQEVTGSISAASHKKWFPQTQWRDLGRGLVEIINVGTSVLNVDANDAVIGFTPKKLLHLDGKEVKVFSRMSPLHYNGYYCWESVWLLEGQALPPEYPPVFHQRDTSDILFGTQADQSSCVPATA